MKYLLNFIWFSFIDLSHNKNLEKGHGTYIFIELKNETLKPTSFVEVENESDMSWLPTKSFLFRISSIGIFLFFFFSPRLKPSMWINNY